MFNTHYQNLAEEIDRAAEQEDETALRLLLERCLDEQEKAKSVDKPLLYFFEGNCHSALAQKHSANVEYIWSWHQSERVAEILSLRKAVADEAFKEVDPLIKAKIFTNLGNNLNQLGRFVEALKYWDQALTIFPNFAMALGNKGQGIMHYAQSLYDSGHMAVLTFFASEVLYKVSEKNTLWDSGSHPDAEAAFKSYYTQAVSYLEHIGYDYDYDLNQWPLGESGEERIYKTWCLSQRLFLSPLNDVCKFSVSAQDVLHLPSHKYAIGETPRFPNYFNILKQEYVSARFMLYQAIHRLDSHYSDRAVLLLDGADATQFGYRTEQLKAAYRIAYSLFDKIAIFLNDYFSIGMNINQVSFRRIWGTTKNKKFTLHPQFENSKNWPLRGLYYVSKDFFDEDFSSTSLPEAKALAQLRNNAEHRFLSVQSYTTQTEGNESHSYIALSQLEEKTLKILSMAREALIYLSLSMNREEDIREKSKDPKLSVPIYAPPIERGF